MSNSIGPFDFIRLSRPPSRPQRRTEREVRPGTSGVTRWGTGTRGEPFSLTSVVDCTSLEAAALMLTSYQAFAGGDPAEITWANHAYQTILAFVESVEPIDDGTHAVLLGVGGLNGTSKAILRCTWVLEAIEVFSE